MPELLFTGARVLDPAAGRDEVTDVRSWPAAGSRPWARASDAAGAETHRRARAVLAPGPRRPAHAPARARASSTRRRSRPAPAPRRWVGSPRSRRWPTPTPSPTTRRIVAEVREKAAAAGLADVFPVGAITEGPGRRVDGRAGRDGRGRRAGVQRRRQLRADRAHAAERARLRQGVPGRRRDRRPLRGRLPRRGRAHARGRSLLLARTRRATRRGRGDDRRARHRDGAHDRRPLHLCHLSSARSVDLVRPPRPRASGSPPRSRRITWCSPTTTCVTYDTNFKMHPPLRTRRGPRGAARRASPTARST